MNLQHYPDDPMARFIACCEALAEQLRDNKTLTEAGSGVAQNVFQRSF